MHIKILNKYYFINKFNQSHIDKVDKSTTIIFRNYNEEINEKLIIKIRNYCKKKGNKFLLSNNIKLALKLNLDGAYIPSFNKDTKHLSYSLKKKFIILGSAHNVYELRTKESQNIEAIFLSSLFKNMTLPICGACPSNSTDSCPFVHAGYLNSLIRPSLYPPTSIDESSLT